MKEKYLLDSLYLNFYVDFYLFENKLPREQMSLINFSFILHVFDFTTSILCKFIDMSYGSWTIYCHAIPSE